ncbi:olfactory receptor 5V1-like [Gastrophryne carolinensis]
MLVSYSKTLHTPMYFFLCQLAISDIMLTSDISPYLLYMALQTGGTMLFEICIFQYFIFGVTECSECLLLTVMSYDRYLAICKPLHYTSIMNKTCCKKLATMSWLVSIVTMMTITITITCLDFCGPHIIDHFYCDISPLLKLSCSDTFLVQYEMIFSGIFMLFLPFLFIVISYICVILTIVKIQSTTGKKKAISTCSSHLTVVFIFYSTLIFIYNLPTSEQSLTVSKLLSLLYTVVTPLINPIIYSLRNMDLMVAFKKATHHLVICTFH